MFGCIVNRFGYSDQFQETNNGIYVLSFQNSIELGNISVFVFDPSCLINCAVEVSVVAKDFYEKVGYITEYSPSITFVTGLERLNRTDLPFNLVLTIIPSESMGQNIEYCPTDYEAALLEQATGKMIDHFQNYLGPTVVEHDGQQYISTKRALAWKEAFIKESKAVSTFWNTN